MPRNTSILPDGRVSLRKYASMSGHALSSVQAAIKSGRITRDSDGFIDPERADMEWAANTDNSRKLTPKTKNKRPECNPESIPEPEIPVGDLNYNEERAKREHWAAKRERLDYELEAGLLVRASEIEEEWVKISQTVRTKLLALPTKARLRLPHLVNEDVTTLDALVRECLEELCERSKA